MITEYWTRLPFPGKTFFFAAGLALLALTACSTNPATGEKQFTALMSPAQEASAGAQEHQKVIQTFGAPKPGDPLQAYVEKVGQKVAADTERKDVQYKFFLLDTPMLNAFALPGGYVYVTRGILAQANDEAELAAVIAHEIGHVTARHSAERISHGALAQVGAMILATVADNPNAARLAGLGSDLYINSYSRQQEMQADELGIRYLSRAGYDPLGMARFLEELGASADLEQQISGRGGDSFIGGYFSSHPRTGDRMAKAVELARQYPQGQPARRDEYLAKIDGMVWGDSPAQGFTRGNTFWHPGMGFTFTVPDGFTIENQPSQVVAVDRRTGAVILFDAAANPSGADPLAYLTRTWMAGQPAAEKAERLEINGMPAATASFQGSVDGAPMTIRMVAVRWDADTIFRFQLAIPRNASNALMDDLKRATYSLRPMTAQEKNMVQPLRLRIVTAKAGDTVSTMAARMAVDEQREARFRVLNALPPGEGVVAGRKYKIITG